MECNILLIKREDKGYIWKCKLCVENDFVYNCIMANQCVLIYARQPMREFVADKLNQRRCLAVKIFLINDQNLYVNELPLWFCAV